MRSEEQVTATWSTEHALAPDGQARTMPVTSERFVFCESVTVLFGLCVHTAGLSTRFNIASRCTETPYHAALAGTTCCGKVRRESRAEQVVDLRRRKEGSGRRVLADGQVACQNPMRILVSEIRWPLAYVTLNAEKGCKVGI